MPLKQNIYTACLQALETKVAVLQNTFRELGEGAENDSKSSAGDKYETARSMIQIEQEKISRQLDDLLKQKAVLQKIDIQTKSTQIIKGSLVKSNKGYLFLSIPLGKLSVDDTDVIVLSSQSPLGIRLMGLTANTSVEINGTVYVVEGIS
jgi:hypothetical protein